MLLIRSWLIRLLSSLEQAFLHLTQPSHHSVVVATAVDLTRRKAELLAENALLRQQLIVLCRQVRKPRFTQSDRVGVQNFIRGDSLIRMGF